MPQAMERLLASPNTTAVLPARSIILFFFLRADARGIDGQPTFRIPSQMRLATSRNQPN
jgi:hypothetical protein